MVGVAHKRPLQAMPMAPSPHPKERGRAPGEPVPQAAGAAVAQRRPQPCRREPTTRKAAAPPPASWYTLSQKTNTRTYRTAPPPEEPLLFKARVSSGSRRALTTRFRHIHERRLAASRARKRPGIKLPLHHHPLLSRSSHYGTCPVRQCTLRARRNYSRRFGPWEARGQLLLLCVARGGEAIGGQGGKHSQSTYPWSLTTAPPPPPKDSSCQGAPLLLQVNGT